MKGGRKAKVVCLHSSVHQVGGYIFQMESSLSVHRHSARHEEENHVSWVCKREKERESKRGGGVYACTETTSVKAISLYGTERKKGIKINVL